MNYELLKNKNCFISGATGGLGKEIAKLLAYNSSNLFLTGRNKNNLENLKKEIQKSINNKIKISYEVGDLNKISDIHKIIKKARLTLPKIDILINSAGIFMIKSLDDSTLEDFEHCFNVNARAPFLFSKEFAKDMIKNKWGRIVNIGSSSSYQAFKDGSIYTASKFAILGISRTLYDELKEYNVRTFCISPGSIKTEMAKISKDQDFSTFLNPKEVAEFIIFQILFDKELIAEETRLNRIIIK